MMMTTLMAPIINVREQIIFYHSNVNVEVSDRCNNTQECHMHSPDHRLKFPVLWESETTGTMAPQHPDLKQIFTDHANICLFTWAGKTVLC